MQALFIILSEFYLRLVAPWIFPKNRGAIFIHFVTKKKLPLTDWAAALSSAIRSNRL
jgi:hypothetical protein